MPESVNLFFSMYVLPLSPKTKVSVLVALQKFTIKSDFFPSNVLPCLIKSVALRIGTLILNLLNAYLIKEIL